MSAINGILQKPDKDKQDIVRLLNTRNDEENLLFEYAAQLKQSTVGNKVYLRGLIELSNVCDKDCFYCGIRCSNENTKRYQLTDEEVMEAVRFAHKSAFGSVAIQSGELQNKPFTEKIDRLLKQTMELSAGEMGVTLSCGEQTSEVYSQWALAGANRYLLRIETSSSTLYKSLHPANDKHSFDARIRAINALKANGYQLGSGVMIGLPFQKVEDLADDLLFLQALDIDMCGMGPYIEHHHTPIYGKYPLLPLDERLRLSLKMVAILRILMPDINIAATTALQCIDKEARMEAIRIGANVLMPNITPKRYRDDYFLYDNKPLSEQSDEDELATLEKSLTRIGHAIGYGVQGNSLHFQKKNRQ